MDSSARLLDDLVPISVRQVKDIDRPVPLGRNLCQRDIHVKFIQDMRQPVQQAQAVLCLQFHNGVGIGVAVVHHNMRWFHKHVEVRAPQRMTPRQRHLFDVLRILKGFAQGLLNAPPHLLVGHGALFESFHV